MKLLDERGEGSMELLEEISESERFRLRTIVAVEMFGLGGGRVRVRRVEWSEYGRL